LGAARLRNFAEKIKSDVPWRRLIEAGSAKLCHLERIGQSNIGFSNQYLFSQACKHSLCTWTRVRYPVVEKCCCVTHMLNQNLLAAPRQRRSLNMIRNRVTVHPPTRGAAKRVSERQRIHRQSPSPPLSGRACCLDTTTVACFVGQFCKACPTKTAQNLLNVALCSAVAAFRSQRSEKWKPGVTAHGGGIFWQKILPETESDG